MARNEGIKTKMSTLQFQVINYSVITKTVFFYSGQMLDINISFLENMKKLTVLVELTSHSYPNNYLIFSLRSLDLSSKYQHLQYM